MAQVALDPRRHRGDAVRHAAIVGHFALGRSIGVAGGRSLHGNRRLAATAAVERPVGGKMHGPAQICGRLAKTTFGDRLREGGSELLLETLQFNAVLRTLRTRDARDDGVQVQLDHLRIVDLALLRHAPQALRPVVGLVNLHLFLWTTGGAEIIGALRVDREEAHCRPILRGHVSNGGAVHDRQGGRARAEEFDKLPNDLRLAQHLGDGQHQVGGRDAFAQRAGQSHADDIRREKVDGLAKHAGLGLDAAHSPAHDAQAIDHCGVRVGAHQRVWIDNLLTGVAARRSGQHALGEVLKVNLVDNPDARRHDFECVKGLHAPF